MAEKLNRARIAASLSATAIAWVSGLYAQTPSEFQQDFEVATGEIGANYAYFDTKATRWNDMPAMYATDLRNVKSRDAFVALLEKVVDELYDPHAQLNTNLASSYRLVPSGTDLWAEWIDGKATITQIRDKSDAERAGIRSGAIVISIDGVAIGDAVEARLGRSYVRTDAPARDWALRSVLAGRHNARRLLELREGAKTKRVELPAADQSFGSGGPLAASEIRPGIGYVRLNDSLGNDATVPAFDRALNELRETRGLIIDLRNTASGGNSSVARGILGRFVQRELPYQKHALPTEERDTGVRRSWLELVSPRGEFAYSKPVVVLVSRWTGSMGEGLAIGFDATKAGTVVGTPMARLVGATEQVVLPHTGIRINIPTERLYHVNGTPREAFEPTMLVDVARATADRDPFLEAALKVLIKNQVQHARDIGSFHVASRGGVLPEPLRSSHVDVRPADHLGRVGIFPARRHFCSRRRQMPEGSLMLKLYAHPFSSYTQKALIALYENATPFEYRFLEEPSAQSELAALWPLKKFPVLVDQDRAIVEATTIIEYLQIHHAGPVRMIPDGDAGIEARMLDRIFDNYVMTPMQKIVLDVRRPESDRDAFGVSEARGMLDTIYTWLNERLAGRKWAAGDAFTLADCAAAPSLFYADWAHPIPDGHANLKSFRARLLGHPSVARAVDEARPFRKYFPLGAPDRD